MKKIQHQKSLTTNGCVRACLAMLIGIDIGCSLMQHYEEKVLKDELRVNDVLAKHDITVIPAYNDLHKGGSICAGKVYLVTVPTIFGVGEMHMIIVDTRENEVVVYDPSYGKKQTHFYTGDEMVARKNSFAHPLYAWMLLAEIEFPEDA